MELNKIFQKRKHLIQGSEWKRENHNTSLKPEFRGKKLGDLMIEKVISISKENGVSKLYLDTALFMSSAVYLYKKFGFKEIGPYPECIVPKELWDKWIFMMKEL